MYDEESQGVYLYGIVKSSEPGNLGKIGINHEQVFLIPYRDICAVVHMCTTNPYITDDGDEAKSWIIAHQYVLDLVTAKYGTVIPITFDTIFKGNENIVRNWLQEKYEELGDMLQNLNGKAEYGVQIFLDKKHLDKITDSEESIITQVKSLKGKPEGVVYLLKKRLEDSKKIHKDQLTQKISKNLLDEIKGLVKEMKIEQIRKTHQELWKDRVMILNASCLLQEEEVKPLGDLLSKINQKKGYKVRFTGPWPPYSFVNGMTKSEEV